jgi:hypothetical protein
MVAFSGGCVDEGKMKEGSLFLHEVFVLSSNFWPIFQPFLVCLTKQLNVSQQHVKYFTSKV